MRIRGKLHSILADRATQAWNFHLGRPRYDWLAASWVLRMNGNGMKGAVITLHGLSRFCINKG